MSGPAFGPPIQELGLVTISPYSETDIHHGELQRQVEEARAPHLLAADADLDWVLELLEDKSAIVDPESEDYTKYRGYLAAAKEKDDFYEGRESDEMSLDEFEQLQLRKHHRMLADAFPITNEYASKFALISSKWHKQDAKQAGVLVGFKYFTRQNVSILEAHLSPEEQEVYAPHEPVKFNVVERDAFADDPEAEALETRYRTLVAMFHRRWAIKTLAAILGSDFDQNIDRTTVEAISQVIEVYGREITS